MMTIAGISFNVSEAGGSSGGSNDEIAGATVIPNLPYSVSVNTQSATTNAADPAHSCASRTTDSKTVWFRYVANFTGSLRVTTTGSNYDTVLTAYPGTTSVGSELACNDDSGASLQSEITFNVTNGIRVVW